MRKGRNNHLTATQRMSKRHITRGKNGIRKKKHTFWIPGVTVITCTNSSDFIDNIFRNYNHQSWKEKELILVLNNDELDINHWSARAGLYPNVRVFQVPQAATLGVCLNFAVEQARHDYVAKFDHDDYYGIRYLTEMMRVFRKKKVDVAGKRSYYTYIEDGNLLIVRFPGNEKKFVGRVHGATFVVKKKVLNRIKFADVPIDDDGIFLRACRAKGLRIYSADLADYVYVRRKGQTGHGWQVDYDYLIRNARVIGHINNLEEIIKLTTKGRAVGCDFKALELEMKISVGGLTDSFSNQVHEDKSQFF